MSQTVSPFTSRSYGLARVSRAWRVSRAGAYRFLKRTTSPAIPRRRGPTGPCPDADLADHIRREIEASDFHGEGYRKLWARLRVAGVRSSPRRVRRVMGENGLLAPHRVGRNQEKMHDGTIVTDKVNEMWGTDMMPGQGSDIAASMRAVIDRLMRVALFGQPCIARPVISAKQADLVGDGLVDEGGKRSAAHVLNDAGDYVSLATHRPDNDGLAVPIALPASLIPMPIAAVAADNGFVDLNDSREFGDVLDHGGPDLVAHEPSRLVRAEAHITEDLQRAHALLADQHQVRDPEPVLERLIRIFKNCPSKIREAVASISARPAFRTLPMPCARMKIIDSLVAAARTADALRPTPSDQVRFAVVLSLKKRIELRCGHLMDGLRLLCAGHGNLPHSIGGQLHV